MKRSDRVGDEIRKVVADLIQHEIKDPRLPDLTSVTEVSVSRDLSHANIYVSVMGSEAAQKDCLAALRSAGGFIRHQIGRKVRLRSLPELHFALDDSIERGIRMGRLIDETLGDKKDDDDRSNP